MWGCAVAQVAGAGRVRQSPLFPGLSQHSGVLAGPGPSLLSLLSPGLSACPVSWLCLAYTLSGPQHYTVLGTPAPTLKLIFLHLFNYLLI